MGKLLAMTILVVLTKVVKFADIKVQRSDAP
jgi:hypothetical protein